MRKCLLQFDASVPDQFAITLVVKAQARGKLFGRRWENFHRLRVPQLTDVGGAENFSDRIAQAIDDFTRALAIDPKKINVLINRGIAWREKGDPDRAIADFSEALRQGLVVGDVLELESQEPEAVRHWQQVAKARYQRGNAYVMKKEFDLAVDDINEAIRINPEDQAAYNNRGLVWLRKQLHGIGRAHV